MARFVKGLLSFVCVYSFEVVKKYIKNGNIKTRLNNLLAQPWHLLKFLIVLILLINKHQLFIFMRGTLLRASFLLIKLLYNIYYY